MLNDFEYDDFEGCICVEDYPQDDLSEYDCLNTISDDDCPEEYDDE